MDEINNLNGSKLIDICVGLGLSRHSLTVHILVRSGASGPGQDWILRGSVAATLKIFLASKMFKIFTELLNLVSGF